MKIKIVPDIVRPPKPQFPMKIRFRVNVIEIRGGIVKLSFECQNLDTLKWEETIKPIELWELSSVYLDYTIQDD